MSIANRLTLPTIRPVARSMACHVAWLPSDQSAPSRHHASAVSRSGHARAGFHRRTSGSFSSSNARGASSATGGRISRSAVSGAPRATLGRRDIGIETEQRASMWRQGEPGGGDGRAGRRREQQRADAATDAGWSPKFTASSRSRGAA